jgi:hypothetical protein
MKKFSYVLLALFTAVALIGACPPPGCKYINDCTTWHLTGTAYTYAGRIHIESLATVGDIPNGYAKTGRYIAILDGEFTCITCGMDDTTYTGKKVEDISLEQGATHIGFSFPADTSVAHTVTIYLAQANCANCAQILVLKTGPDYITPKPIWLQLWVSTEPIFNIGVTPGPDNGCFVYDLDGAIIPTSTAANICSAAPNANMKLVYTGWITLPRPGTAECWSSYKDAAKCDHEGDKLLAKINAEHGWHLTFAWFFPGYGGH